ncbi:MAG: T9SS type A sorting domain-containing protein, partial [bacterium]
VTGECLETPVADGTACDDGDPCTENDVCLSGVCVGTPVTCCTCGDVNCDGQITPGDALCAFWRFILGEWQEECECDCSEQAADVNCDGQITPGDALCVFWRFILGDWTPECPACQCGLPGKASGQAMTASNVSLAEVRGLPRSMMRVSILVHNPQNLSAFGMDLTFPEDLLEFQGVFRTPLTQDWIAMDGVVTGQSVVTIGGFHTEGVSSTGPVAVVDALFAVREGANGRGEFTLSNLVDDLKGANVSKGCFVVKAVPTAYALEQNYPNPFNSETAIRYQLAETGRVRLTVYNILGEEVAVLVDEQKEAGYYRTTWQGKEARGTDVSSGVYVYRIQSGNFTQTRKCLFLR